MPLSKKVMKLVIFTALLVVLLRTLSTTLELKRLDGLYYTTQSFYSQPDDTVEVVFLGTSVMFGGIIPTELYENYGICSFNLGSSVQPILASYYWLLESEKYHSDTLSTVVLDVSSLRGNNVEDRYKMAFSEMKYSEHKLLAIHDITDTLNDFLNFSVPLFSFHTRWKELVITDINLNINDNRTFTSRGYIRTEGSVIESSTYNEISIPNYLLDDEITEYEFDEEALLYLKRMITFCDEEEIELVLIEVPRQDWTDAQHNGMQSIADEYNLNFLDFNYSPYIDEIDYNTAIDSIEGYHLNYYGSTKLTEWIGNYLITFCNVTDVRGSSEYEFLQDELDSYKKSIIDVKLDEFTDVSDYLLYVSEQDNLSALITIKTEATLSLTEEQRAQFVECGLTNLSELDYRNSYIGIIENGEVIFEETSLGESVETEVLDDSTAKLNDLYSIEDTVTEMFHLETDNITNETLYLEFNGNLIDGTSIVLQSGGYYQGNISSCIIGGIEYSMNSRGINIVVYNNETQTVVDTACFDTCISPMRSSQNTEIALNNLLEDGMTVDQLTGVYREVYLYNLRCEDAYTIEILNNSIDETGLYQYLTTFWNDDDYAIFLSVQNDASSALDTIARTALSELGLNALSSLNTQDSYLAIIDGGEVIVENSSPDGSYLTEELLDYVIVSGTTDSGETSSIKIDGTEYSPKSDGINVVVYNKTTNLLVDARTFNTGLYPVTIEGGE